MSKTVDVLIVGGGPTGLITAYNLLKAGISVHLVERNSNSVQALYGRAFLIWPRSLELLDQLGIYDEMSDIGFILRGGPNYRNGKKLEGTGLTIITEQAILGNTFFAHLLGLRQKYLEDILRSLIRKLDASALSASTNFVDYYHANNDDGAQHPITVRLNKHGSTEYIKCKHLIGADGARSTVRNKANINFSVISSGQIWVRLDGVVKTDVPDAREYTTFLESPTHGTVLWAPIDHGRTRIGYVLPAALSEAYDKGKEITAEIAMEEAKKALAPFYLEFETLDWYTVYSINQGVAETYLKNGAILAGDACHTHSSGMAQGMNAGIHDAINLSWKLGGYLQGWYTRDVFLTYDSERRAFAQQLIDLDIETASLMSGVIPPHLKDKVPEDFDTKEALNECFKRSAGFTVGLAINYSANILNRGFSDTLATKCQAGHRLMDAMLEPPGARAPRRLYDLMPNTGQFYIIVCVGARDSIPKRSLRILDMYLSGPQSFTRRLHSAAFAFLTIISGHVNQAWELLGVEPWGHVYYDPQGAAYNTWGIDLAKGAILAVRPDGILGHVVSVDAPEQLGAYFDGIVLPRKADSAADIDGTEVIRNGSANLPVGEISVQNEPERMVLAKL
ncbi:putative 2,4-dichlorophenol 6-monooxygenase [Sistotremastrum suecicum HHB10207 ss-3]|uniref:Putative 2,4-dichlorophenol 6-monooxygenase n=1 Tax=Sistotremastrum suecicum HHB10207 ss-3 TaxID=1314776 RepID=A0A166FT39_9AGAM|nr:putative 2,4-dichlorophenol 6-monooxygenase [Sistotremastrum suecicum HHB10207 ss-3]